MTGDNTEVLKGEQSLASLLEFLARLDESEEVKKKVLTEIEQKVKGYVKDDGKFGNPTTGYLFQTIRKSSELRKNILKTDGTYKHYTESFNSDDVSDEQYAKLLIDNVFPLFGCLYYMYYECNLKCTYFDGGGKWQSEKCNGDQGPDLNNWLKDTTGTGSGRMIKRNYQQGDLGQKTGKQLFPSGSSNALSYYKEAAQLQSALFFMLFLPEDGKWDNAKSGHAVLFLEAFSEKVTKEGFQDHYKHDGISMEDLKSSCKTLKDKITALIDSNTIVPVAWSPKVNYGSLLQPEHFSKYIGWLKDNLKELIKSLEAMDSDVTNWDKESLETSKSFGPFPWGFVFKSDEWDTKKGVFKSKLQELNKQLESFKNTSTSTSEGKDRTRRDTESSSSAGSTVGGVAAGLGAAGAAGAAAYSGVLGPVAEAVGRFFKGLVL